MCELKCNNAKRIKHCPKKDCGAPDSDCICNICSFILSSETEEERMKEESMFARDSLLIHDISKCINSYFADYIDDPDRGTDIIYKCKFGIDVCYGCSKFEKK